MRGDFASRSLLLEKQTYFPVGRSARVVVVVSVVGSLLAHEPITRIMRGHKTRADVWLLVTDLCMHSVRFHGSLI